MAEIKIVKKRVVWPYVVAILIVVAAILFYLYYTGNLSIEDETPVIGTDGRINNGTGLYIPKAVNFNYSLI